MEKFLAWWRRGQRDDMLLKSLVLALLPLLCCVVYCALQGRWIGDVYLPASQWNDELFYYKQVESILNGGYPLGYFGFNESHALKLSFAAWSPVLVFPWVLWGLVFGWNLMSPILCNIFLMSLSCFLYVWLVRPSWKQMGVLGLLFCLYTNFPRYMLSGMAEVICFAMLISFYSLAIHYQRRKKGWELAVLFLVSGLMTLMRPYLVLFMLLPSFFWVCRGKGRLSKWMGALGSVLAIGATLGIYGCVNHYLSAEYFAPLFFTDWFQAFFEQGLWGGLKFTLDKFLAAGEEFIAFAKQGIRVGTTTGTVFAGYLVCLCVLSVQSFEEWAASRRPGGRRAESLAAIEAHLALSFLIMLPALFLMYKLIEGSRHLLTFLAAAVFVIPLARKRLPAKAACVGAAFAFLYIYRAVSPYDYQVPFVGEERQASMEEWQDVFSGYLAVDRENAPSYDNVIIWTYHDLVDGESVHTAWQLLYALPKGYGISCCMRDYLVESIGSLKSHYLLGPVGGEIETLCEEAGYKALYSDGAMILYEIRQ